ncbi:LacI family DNA-binding transcriptional regulator [Roseibacterium sp. SDUM158017]|uniref:LacI family DNA-binding transcriptional regulator n=1 Tax=Roseicyclus salinarum TaxID=3036773 RepID=UPI0024154C9F|nr:LacI family DNA-binding transcriptional regulator [Roseibacterium sp. SDUM158017]MDG4650413.1 LacI family DNA-binding transcriptional regulator [Roseibacterium sp. SDUM158017]
MPPTLRDVAREAGVSAATVDRVLHDRPGVSARMRARVLGAARQLGYLVQDVADTTRPVRLVALLPAGTNAFIEDLALRLSREAAGMAGVGLRIERPDPLDGAGLAERLLAQKGRAEGVAVVAVNHPAVREALRALDEAGVRVVTLASDVPGVPRTGYVGIDNGQAGRLAGLLIGRFLGPGAAGKVALFAGTLAYRGHQEREMGFRQVLAEEFPRLEILELRESREDRDRAAAEARGLFAQHPDLRAIYNAGGATMGVAEALKAEGRARDVVLVAHDATAEKTALLLDGTLDAVIDQDAGAEAREALERLSAAVRGEARAPIPLRLQLILRENLPAA